jgi:hypothetical protein
MPGNTRWVQSAGARTSACQVGSRGARGPTTGGITMNPRSLVPRLASRTLGVSRRVAVRRLLAGGGAALIAGQGLTRGAAQEASPAAGQCVATAPPTEDGVGLATLLAGGIVHDMPAGPVKVGIYRFTLEPGTPFPPGVGPNPALMYIEIGASDCPGGARPHRLQPRRHHPRHGDRRRRPARPGRHHPVHPGECTGRGGQRRDRVDVLAGHRVRPG